MAAFQRLIALLALALVAPAWSLSITYPSPSTGQLVTSQLSGPASEMGRLLTLNGGMVKVHDPLAGRVGGKDVALSVARSVSPAQIAKGLVGATGVGALMIAAEMALQHRCKPDASGSWSCDDGKPKVPTDKAYIGNCRTQITADSASAGYQQCAEQWKAFFIASEVGSYNYKAVIKGSASCAEYPTSFTCYGLNITRTYTNQAGNSTYESVSQVGWSGQITSGLVCKEPSVEFKGKCTQPETDWRPHSVDSVLPKVEDIVKNNPLEHLTDGLNKGAKFDTAKGVLSGPSSVQQAPKVQTVTGPQGQPQTTTTNVTNHITYMGDSFSWTTITTINKPDGTIDQTEETPEKDDRTECEKDPDALGCQERDTPEPDEIGTKEIPVTYSPDGGWAEAGSCPPNVQLALLGQSFAVEYTPTCNFLIGMRPFVIAAAAMAALLIFIAGLKE
jgi:hypothetical protein